MISSDALVGISLSVVSDVEWLLGYAFGVTMMDGAGQSKADRVRVALREAIEGGDVRPVSTLRSDLRRAEYLRDDALRALHRADARLVEMKAAFNPCSEDCVFHLPTAHDHGCPNRDAWPRVR